MPGMNMPDMQMPAGSASPNPQASPQQMHNMPGMQMPATSPAPNPQASPAADAQHAGYADAGDFTCTESASVAASNGHEHAMPAASPSSGTTHTHGEHPAPMGNMDMSSANKGQPASGL